MATQAAAVLVLGAAAKGWYCLLQGAAGRSCPRLAARECDDAARQVVARLDGAACVGPGGKSPGAAPRSLSVRAAVAMADAMEKRLRGLIRKADAHTPPELKTAAVRDGLISALATSISRKREYDDLFASSDAVAAWAASRGLPEQQTRLLQLMRRHKDIFIPNPILDAVLTAAFGAECVFVLWDLNTKHLVLLFIVLLLLADAVITRVKGLFTEWGRALSTWLFRRGFVESDPLSGRIQMKKWTDQSWQLFVHVLFAGMEAWILYEEPWYDNPATCWMPHVYSMRGRFREDLVVLYLAQLVRRCGHTRAHRHAATPPRLFTPLAGRLGLHLHRSPLL